MKFFILFFLTFSVYAQRPCINDSVRLEVAHHQRHKYILFFKTHLIKYRRTDKIVDINNKVIAQTTMKSTGGGDAYNTPVFRRIVLMNGEIHKVSISLYQKQGTIIRYDLCGNRISKEKIDPKKLDDLYGFTNNHQGD